MTYLTNSLEGPQRPSTSKPTVAANERHTTAGNLSFAERVSIFSDGERAEATYLIVAGAVALTRTTFEGKRQILEILGPGDLFGISASDTYETSAETLARTVVRRIAPKDIIRSERLQREITAHLTRKVVRLHDHVARLGRKSAMERVASFLVGLPRAAGGMRSGMLACATDGKMIGDERIALPLADIGDYLGLNIETVCRVLARLKRAKIIAQPRRTKLVIMDQKRLRQLALGYESAIAVLEGA